MLHEIQYSPFCSRKMDEMLHFMQYLQPYLLAFRLHPEPEASRTNAGPLKLQIAVGQQSSEHRKSSRSPPPTASCLIVFTKIPAACLRRKHLSIIGRHLRLWVDEAARLDDNSPKLTVNDSVMSTAFSTAARHPLHTDSACRSESPNGSDGPSKF